MMKKLISIIVLLAAITVAWFAYDVHKFMNSAMNLPETGHVLEVAQGSNLIRIANKLAKDQIISQPKYLVWYARLNRHAHKIYVGEYKLQHQMTPKMLLMQLDQGEVIQYAITIVEGWNFKQLLAAVKSHNALKHTLTSYEPMQVMQQLGYKGVHPEGQFLPDTYHFPRHLTDVDFLKRAYVSMQDYLAAEWERRDVGLPIKTPAEALVLASIVEKETGLASERGAIAGVFTRRLEKRMRLQSDPTVIYGMGDRYKGNIRRRDLLEDTPYNTYRRGGLPPTPIALPGRDAISAVLHPADGDALYFVAKGDGSHYFSENLKEHNNAVIKYQLKGRKRPFSSYKPTTQSK